MEKRQKKVLEGGRMDKDGRKIRERQKNVRGGGLCREEWIKMSEKLGSDRKC